MNIYYTSRPVLFFMCAGNEAFYAAIYLNYFATGPISKYFVIYNNYLSIPTLSIIIEFILMSFVFKIQQFSRGIMIISLLWPILGLDFIFFF